MIDITKLSSDCEIRKLYDSDSESIVELCRDNMQFYKYCELKPTKEQILHDLHITPPGIDISSKYYIGFYQKDVLVAVMDLIDGYPKPDFALNVQHGKVLTSEEAAAVTRESFWNSL